MKTNKKNKILTGIMVFLIIVLAGITYAYFTADILGNDESSKNIVRSGDYSIEFDGTNNVSASKMAPGDTITKVFTVKNTSTKDISDTYNIYLDNYVNSFAPGEVTYGLTCTSNIGTCSGMGDTQLTDSNPGNLLSNTGMKVNEIHTYVLTIKYLETSSLQSKSGNLKFTVKVSAN